MLTCEPLAFTVATMVKVAVAPLEKLPIFHVDKTQEPTEGVALTMVYPACNTSETSTPVASFGPLFVAVTVKVTLLPIIGFGLSTVLEIAKSAQVVTTTL